MSRLLGGRVIHDQPEDGHRSGIEPVLLAASIAARPGEHVLEGGTGSGAALLCLAARIAITGLGVECDPVRAAMAAANFRSNGFALTCVQADLASYVPAMPVDHALANPPWHDPAGTASPDGAREAARRGQPGLLALWVACLARKLRHHGTLTLIIATAVLPESLAALTAAGCGSPTVLPLWPRVSTPARLVLVRGVAGGRGPARLLPGLVLHGPDGSYTEAAEGILRHGDALTL